MGMHLGAVSSAYWTFCWKFLTPAVLATLLVMSWINTGKLSYGDYVYPWGAQVRPRLLQTNASTPLPLFFKVFFNLQADITSILYN